MAQLFRSIRKIPWRHAPKFHSRGVASDHGRVARPVDAEGGSISDVARAGDAEGDSISDVAKGGGYPHSKPISPLIKPKHVLKAARLGRVPIDQLLKLLKQQVLEGTATANTVDICLGFARPPKSSKSPSTSKQLAWWSLRWLLEDPSRWTHFYRHQNWIQLLCYHAFHGGLESYMVQWFEVETPLGMDAGDDVKWRNRLFYELLAAHARLRKGAGPDNLISFYLDKVEKIKMARSSNAASTGLAAVQWTCVVIFLSHEIGWRAERNKKMTPEIWRRFTDHFEHECLPELRLSGRYPFVEIADFELAALHLYNPTAPTFEPTLSLLRSYSELYSKVPRAWWWLTALTRYEHYIPKAAELARAAGREADAQWMEQIGPTMSAQPRTDRKDEESKRSE